MTQIALWSASRPIGGVTRSADQVLRWLQAREHSAALLDLSRPLLLPVARLQARQAGLHIFWCSTLAATGRHAWLARAAPRPRWLMVHGGPPQPVAARGLSRFDRIFATNDRLVDALGSVAPVGLSVDLASAHTPVRSAVKRSTTSSKLKVLLACGQRFSWYRPDIGLEALREAGASLGDIDVTVLSYGSRGCVEANQRRLATYEGVRFVVNADRSSLYHEIADHDVLLRPGPVDGDSLLVREALDLGLRVVASDAVPRPAGVEIASGTKEELAKVLVAGGRVATGEGLGPALVDFLEEFLRT